MRMIIKESFRNMIICSKDSYGVKIVSDSPISRSAALEDIPNAETLAAMKEAESGHDAGVVRVDSLESFCNIVVTLCW